MNNLDFSTLFYFNPLPHWVYDMDTLEILEVNQSTLDLYGYTKDEFLTLTVKDIMDDEELSRLLMVHKFILSHKGNKHFGTFIHHKKDGSVFHAEMNGLRTGFQDRENCCMLVCRDVTDSMNQQFQKDFLSSVSAIFNEGVNFNLSLERLCELIANFGKFSLCEIWLPAIHQRTLKLTAHAEMDAAAHEFYAHSRNIQEIEFGKGLPGNVWKSKESILWENINVNEIFIRNNAARKAGLKSTLGIPLTHQEKIVGIMVVATKEDIDKMEGYRFILTSIESFIGSEISRKRLESDLNHLFDTLPDIICITDFRGYFLKINNAGVELLGYEEHEIVGHPLEEFTHSLDKAVFANEIEKGEPILNFENRYITKNNDIIWLQWHCNVIKEEGVIYATAKNITEEKKLREIVSDATQMAKIGGWEIDLVTNTIYWSKIVHELHETDPLSFKPTPSSSIDFYREDYKEKTIEIFKKSVETREPFDFEAPIITAKGNQLWIRAIGTTEFVGDTCVRIYGSFQDINSIKETEMLLKSITDDLPGVVFQYFIYPNATNKLTAVSKASQKIWGFSPEECEKDSALVWEQVKKGGDYEAIMQVIGHSISTLKPWHSKWRYVLPNGELRWHEGYGTPYVLPNGVIRLNSMIFDITNEIKVTNIYEETSKLARIGSWELRLVENQHNDSMYWSPMVREIIEVGEDYDASLSGGIEFYTEESKVIVKNAIDQLIKYGIEYDEEVLLNTKSGQEKWVRIIGKSERIDGVCTIIFGSIQDIHAMKTAQIQLAEILGSISDGFYALDSNWNVTYFNKEAEKLLNRKSSEVLGKNVWEEFKHIKSTELEIVYRKVVNSGKPINFEYLYPVDGSWYEINVYPSNGGISVYFKNIDDRKKTAEELQRAYEERNQILESIGDAFFALDKDWIVTYWNKEAEYVLGKKREVVLGKNLWKEYAYEIDSDFYREYHKAVSTGKTVSFEEYSSVLQKWFEVTAYPNSEGLSVYFRDITLRKESDIRLLQANERFEKVTKASTDAIWDWDIENDIFHRGEGFDKLFGYDVKKTLMGDMIWKDSFHPKDLPRIKASLYECINSKAEYWRQEYRIVQKNGEEKTVIDKGIVIRDTKGKAIRMVGAITDISHRVVHEKEILELNKVLKRHIKELEISNEELEQFAYIASHDLQEPLRMISSFLNQLQRKYGDQLDDKAHQYIHFATDGAKRMKQIILDLLEYSKASKASNNIEIVDLNELIEEYNILRRRLIQDKKAKIITGDLPNVKCYKAPLVQTLHSLLDNAIKYSKENEPPIINISASETKNHWQISIEDNGIGIDPAFYDKIFIIFQRLHNRDRYDGTGIGLSIAKKHVELWGGKIWVESELGIGSTFHFTIGKT